MKLFNYFVNAENDIIFALVCQYIFCVFYEFIPFFKIFLFLLDKSEKLSYNKVKEKVFCC